MRRAVWEWIVQADDWITEAALDAATAVIVALVVTESLRSLIISLQPG
jgi:hypothetical protein